MAEFSSRRSGAALFVETLESRELLSATLALTAHAAVRKHVAVHVKHLHEPAPKKANDALANVQATTDLHVKSSAQSGPMSYTPAQIRAAYGLTGSSGNGSGETIAIVDAYYDPSLGSDLQTFDQKYGLPTTDAAGIGSLTQLTYTMTQDASWGLETSLDVEWAHAIAPKAHLMVVEAASASTSDLLTAVDYADANGANVVSMSWGGGEFSSEASYDSHFRKAGVAFVASAGDTGGQAEWPAESPDVLSVGGTYLTTDTVTGARYNETAWGTSSSSAAGTGGGISLYEAKPTYQQGLTPGSRRTSPDVSYSGDPNSGFYVYDSNYNGQAGWFDVGGTSAGAPQWAAMIAIADQQRLAAHPNALRLDTSSSYSTTSPRTSSNVLAKVYLATTNNTTRLSATGQPDFYDVTTGTAGSNKAGVGYDLTTGNGSPFADQLIADLAAIS
jgi:subtilase family serine protease